MKGDDGKWRLQAWANVENTSDEDWNDIKLTLVSSRPISFQMDLYPPLFIPRPTVEPALFASLRPPTYGGPITNAAINVPGFGLQGGAGFGGGGFGGELEHGGGARTTDVARAMRTSRADRPIRRAAWPSSAMLGGQFGQAGRPLGQSTPSTATRTTTCSVDNNGGRLNYDADEEQRRLGEQRQQSKDNERPSSSPSNSAAP